MLQNATLLRKSAASPPNISDGHVSCTVPATRNASLQILCKCPTPAIVFGNATKPSHTLTFFSLLARCPCARHAKPHLNFQKWSGHVVLLTFWLGHVLRATTAYTFSRSQLPKVVRTWCVLWVCFVHFDLAMCFAPQRRALFRHLNFQKWLDVGVFCTFCLRNMLRATTACTSHISTSKSGPTLVCFVTLWLGNVLRATTAYNISSLIWPDGSAPAALASLLFAHLHLLSSDSFSSLLFSLLLFSSLTLLTSAFPSCRKFDF